MKTLRSSEKPQRPARPGCEKDFARGKEKVSKKELWELFFELRRLKVFINFFRARVSRNRKDREWAAFIRRAWFEDSEVFDLLASDLVYSATVPFTTLEYEGETKVGVESRTKSHIGNSTGSGKKSTLGKVLSKLGAGAAVFTPAFMWSGRTTKHARLKQEGLYIWERQGSMNTLGTERWDSTSKRTQVVLGRRRRFRLFKRFVKLKKVTLVDGAEVQTLSAKCEDRKVRQQRHDDESKRRGRLVGVVARMARRPWKAAIDHLPLPSLKTVQNIAEMPRLLLKRLLRMIYECLDSTGRSIALANMKLAIRSRRDVVFIRWAVKSPIFFSDECKKAVLKALRKWAADWERAAGILVVIELAVLERASRSILDILDSTKLKGKKKLEELG